MHETVVNRVRNTQTQKITDKCVNINYGEITIEAFTSVFLLMCYFVNEKTEA
jgi:hypothetical protein